jgi:peptide/nickel transport system permease protein
VEKGPLWIALRRLLHHPFAIIGGGVLLVLYGLAIFADFIAPYHYDNEARKNPYHPPTPIQFFDTKGRFHLRPFIYRYRWRWDEYGRRIYTKDTEKIYPIRPFVKGDPWRFLGIFETRIRLFGVEPPARIYLIGADGRGRCLFSRILYGARVSLSIGLVGTFVSFLLGMSIGGIAGYFGGRVDGIIMRGCEIVMMVPGFYLMLALRAAFPPELSSVEVYFLIVVILSFIGWAGMARVVRGIALSLREMEFSMAAKAAGAGSLRIIYHHILPNILSYAIVSLTLSIPSYILGESALSLLGLGIQDPHASWGNLLRDAMSIACITYHPWILTPGLFIFIAVMAFNLLGDGLRDAFDPKALEGRR